MTVSSSGSFDARRGTLRVPAEEVRRLARGELGGVLTEVGAVVDGEPHPRLRDTVDALRRPVGGTFQLAYRGRALDGWCGEHAAALLAPDDGTGSRTLVGVAPPRLPRALARAAGLVPRPVPTSVADPGSLADVVRWWRLRHGPVGALLEVVDTPGGLYVVDAPGRAVPTDAGAVLRLITWVVGRGPVVAPLRPLPLDAELPVAAPCAGEITTGSRAQGATWG